MPRYGATGEDDCVMCPSGFYCPIDGTITPTLCEVGQFCPENSDAVSDCNPGYYCPIYTRVELFTIPRTDPAGNSYPDSRGPAE